MPLRVQTDAAAAAFLAEAADRVRAAAAAGARVRVQGAGSKDFLARPAGSAAARLSLQASPLDMRPYAGIVAHVPSELVVTVRAGTPLAELEAALAQAGQFLPFEPPRLAGEALGTVGGMVASGLSGPARASVGGVRDYVLGAMLLNGRGELGNYGGEVMKNVAGYDIARLLAGAWGALGAICEVSLKVLPQPRASATLRFDLDQAAALQTLNRWAGQPLPLQASVWWQGTLAVRLAGAEAAVQAAVQRLGGERIPDDLAGGFWQGLRDQHDEFFDEARAQIDAGPAGDDGLALWRLSLPSTTPPLAHDGAPLIEWHGAQRWLLAPAGDVLLDVAAAAAGGTARRWRVHPQFSGRGAAPRRDAAALVQRRLKTAFDPQDVFVAGHPVDQELAPADLAASAGQPA